jgi:NADH:ubiquinone oxidoreductase subunit
MSVLSRFFAALSGSPIGTDRFGNRYYESRADYGAYGRKRRTVVYAGKPDPTSVPPEWHGWLHHTADAPLPEARKHPWMIEHRPNPTGTAQSWRPAGHDYSGGQRARSAGDYDAWTPDSR